MEIKINKEISEYQENLFFGLSTRQAFCSCLAIGVAVGTYFLTSAYVGKEISSWLCIILSAPIAIAGFFKYNGMNFEKFVIEVIKSEILYSGIRIYKSSNIIENLQKEVLKDVKRNDKHKRCNKKNK